MQVLILGYGEIGESLGQIIKEAGHNIEVFDPNKNMIPKSTKFDFIHITFPFADNRSYIESCMYFLKTYKGITFIHSTIPLGICEELQKESESIIFHVPARGTHPHIYQGMRMYCNFIGIADKNRANIELFEKIDEYFKTLDIPYRFLDSANETVIGKLIDTTYYALLIAFANQIKLLCDKEGINFDQAYKDFQRSSAIGREYFWNGTRAIAKESIPRCITIPGTIDGHCLIPNLDLLEQSMRQYGNNLMIKWIRRMHIAFGGDDFKYDADKKRFVRKAQGC